MLQVILLLEGVLRLAQSSSSCPLLSMNNHHYGAQQQADCILLVFSRYLPLWPSVCWNYLTLRHNGLLFLIRSSGSTFIFPVTVPVLHCTADIALLTTLRDNNSNPYGICGHSLITFLILDERALPLQRIKVPRLGQFFFIYPNAPSWRCRVS